MSKHPSTRSGIHQAGAKTPQEGSLPLDDPKHEKFAQLIAAGSTLGRAYKDCGYATEHAPNAYRLMHKQNVRSRIAFLQQKAADTMIAAQGDVVKKAAEKQALTKQWVVERLMEIVNRCMQAEPVRDAAGEVIGIFTFNATGANQSLQMLGKEVGMFVDRSKVEIDVRDLTPEKLELLLAEMERTILAGHAAELAAIRESAVAEIRGGADYRLLLPGIGAKPESSEPSPILDVVPEPEGDAPPPMPEEEPKLEPEATARRAPGAAIPAGVPVVEDDF